MEIWEPKLPRTLWATPGLLRDCFIFLYVKYTHAIHLTLILTQHFQFRFLGSFIKLRKATISFIMSVRPPAWNNSASTRRVFMKFYI